MKEPRYVVIAKTLNGRGTKRVMEHGAETFTDGWFIGGDSISNLGTREAPNRIQLTLEEAVKIQSQCLHEERTIGKQGVETKIYRLVEVKDR